MIDMASVYAKRFERNPQMLQAAVMGQSPDPKLDPYTALNALRLLKESNMAAMAGRAQQPTSSPSIVAETMAPQRGLGAMVPGAMGQAPQGMPPQVAQAPQAPQAPVMQASGGLAGLPTPDEDYAEGGIVAFQSGGLNPAVTQGMEAPAVAATPSFDTTETDEDTDTETEEPSTGVGNAGLQAMAFGELQKSINRMRSIERREPTKAEKAAMFKDIVGQLENVGGPDIYGDVNKSLNVREADLGKNLSQDQGLALIAAAGHVLKGRTLAEGASNAAPTFASHMAEANRNSQAEKRAIESMRFNVNDAQRKERMGNRRAAMSAMSEARKDEQAAATFKLNQEKAISSALGTAMRATRPGAAGAGAKPPKLAERLYDDNLANMMQTEQPKEGETPAQFNARMRAAAGELTAKQIKDYGPTKAGSEEAKLAGKTDTELDTQVRKDRIFDQAWQDAKTPEEKDAAETAIRNRIIARRQAQAPATGKPSGGGVNKNSTNAPDISTIKGAPEGAKIGSKTAKGWEVLDSSGKLLGYAK